MRLCLCWFPWCFCLLSECYLLEWLCVILLVDPVIRPSCLSFLVYEHSGCYVLIAVLRMDFFAKQIQHPFAKQRNAKKFSVHHWRRQFANHGKKCERLSRSQRVCHVQPRGWQWQQQRGSEPSWLNLSLLQAAHCLKYAFKSSVVSSRIHLRADLQLHLQALSIGIGITSEKFTFGNAKTIRKIKLWWTTTKENICKPGDCQQARQ